jgi:hypothetical protein
LDFWCFNVTFNNISAISWQSVLVALTIFYAELSDAGIYTCFASNSYGTRESDMTTLMVSGTLFLVSPLSTIFQLYHGDQP